MYIYKNNTTSTTNMTNTTIINTLELPLTSLGDEDWRFNDYNFYI